MVTSILRLFTNSFTRTSFLFAKLRIHLYEFVRFSACYVANGLYCMLGFVDCFSNKWLAFPLEQTVPRYWLTCFSISIKMSFWINSLRKAKESLLESSIYHTIILMTLSLSIIKDLRSSLLIFTLKNSQFLKPQYLLQLLLILICFHPR